MSAGLKEAVEWAEAVLDGSFIACDYIKKACQRFFDDFEIAEEQGFYFDHEEAQLVCDFFPLFCRHIKGRQWKGKPVELEPWQAFSLINVFGWKWTKTDTRRFATVYEEVARKNAKSTKSSGVALWLTGLDGEGGAEVYSAATTKDQAKIVFNDAVEMVAQSRLLKRVFGSLKNSIFTHEDSSFFKPLASDADSLDGLNVHGAVVDELHAHKKRDVWDVLETATGAREQPLLWAITTAGTNKLGICFELRTYAAKVLDGTVQDNSFFALIFTLDDGDDWLDESNWVKANPNLGISKSIDDMRRLAKKAAEVPTAKANFLTKHLNIWVNSASTWMNSDFWNKCPPLAPAEELRRFDGFMAMDLSNKLDIAAVMLVLRDPEGELHLVPRFFLPEDRVNDKPRSIGNLYRTWAEQGLIELTPGNVIDHEYIFDVIKNLCTEYNVNECGYDSWGSTQLAIKLQEWGLPMIEIPQTTKNFSEAMKEVEVLVHSGRLHHGANPVLDWMASNVTAEVDRNENVFPRKEHPDNKIDGMVALIMAVSRIIRHFDGSSPWEDEDFSMEQ